MRDKEAAVALCHQASELNDAGQREEALAAWDEVRAKFSDSHHPEVRSWVAMAMMLRGTNLAVMDRDKEAVATFDEVISLFGGDSDPEIQGHVHDAEIYRLRSLDDIKRWQPPTPPTHAAAPDPEPDRGGFWHRHHHQHP